MGTQSIMESLEISGSLVTYSGIDSMFLEKSETLEVHRVAELTHEGHSLGTCLIRVEVR